MPDKKTTTQTFNVQYKTDSDLVMKQTVVAETFEMSGTDATFKTGGETVGFIPNVVSVKPVVPEESKPEDPKPDV